VYFDLPSNFSKDHAVFLLSVLSSLAWAEWLSRDRLLHGDPAITDHACNELTCRSRSNPRIPSMDLLQHGFARCRTCGCSTPFRMAFGMGWVSIFRATPDLHKSILGIPSGESRSSPILPRFYVSHQLIERPRELRGQRLEPQTAARDDLVFEERWPRAGGVNPRPWSSREIARRVERAKICKC